MQSKSSDMLKNMLTLMGDNELHSGEELALSLKVTRAAIWKQIQKAIRDGFAIEALHGAGYRLVEKLDLLREHQLSNELKMVSGLECFWEIDSTNDALLRKIQIDNTLPSFCIIAESQTKGRGRRGKSWVSPLGKNLYFSISLPLDAGKTPIEGLSIVVGMTVADLLHSLGLREANLKWPNDILMQGKKVGGILLEIVGDPKGQCQVIIGIGLNVYKANITGESISQPWTALNEYLPEVDLDRTSILIKLIKSILYNVDVFSEHGFLPFYVKWPSYDAFLGKEVVVLYGDRIELGVAEGISRDGEFLLGTANGTKSLRSGELSLRLKS